MADRIALGFRDEIDGSHRFTIIYPAEDGLQMLSAAGPTSPDISVAFGFEQVARYPLVSDGDRTWAVDPDDPTVSYLVSTRFEVVDTALEGRVAFVDTSRDPIRVGISSFGAWGAGFEVPESSKILPVPGRGLLIMPLTGGTFIVTATGVDQVSDDSAVAASVSGEVYQRCDEALTCELYAITPEVPEGQRLNLPAGSPISISPNGQLLTWTDDDTDVVTIIDMAALTRPVRDPAVSDAAAADGARRFEAPDLLALGWAPDSSFLAAVTRTELLITFTDGQRPLTRFPLPAEPSSDSVLVVSTPA